MAARTPAQEADAVERGRKALFTRAFTPAAWSVDSYRQAWKQWQPSPRNEPANYSQAFMDYYGLHAAPFDNAYPMGLRIGSRFLGKGITTDCMLCHGGSIAGKSYVGLGNAALDIHALFEDMAKASGIDQELAVHLQQRPRHHAKQRAFAVFLLSLSRPRSQDSLQAGSISACGTNLCEDVPAWWLLKKKKTMYYTGGTNARSVRSLMQFMLSPPQSAEFFAKEEATFRDIQAFLLTLEPPKYPFAHRQDAGGQGRKRLQQDCATLPRHLRRKVDLSQQDRPARRDRHRPHALRRHHQQLGQTTTTRAGLRQENARRQRWHR